MLPHTSTRTIPPTIVTTRRIRTPTIIMAKLNNNPITRFQGIRNPLKPALTRITPRAPSRHCRIIHVCYAPQETVLQVLTPSFCAVMPTARRFGAVAREENRGDVRGVAGAEGCALGGFRERMNGRSWDSRDSYHECSLLLSHLEVLLLRRT